MWARDEAGPYRAAPRQGGSWRPREEPARSPHEYARGGTAKLLALLHPAGGEVRAKGVTSSADAAPHPWPKEELAAILAGLPEPEVALGREENRALRERRRQGLSVKITLGEELPPLRTLLVPDDLTGHKTPELVLWQRGPHAQTHPRPRHHPGEKAMRVAIDPLDPPLGPGHQAPDVVAVR